MTYSKECVKKTNKPHFCSIKNVHRQNKQSHALAPPCKALLNTMFPTPINRVPHQCHDTKASNTNSHLRHSNQPPNHHCMSEKLGIPQIMLINAAFHLHCKSYVHQSHSAFAPSRTTIPNLVLP